MKRFFGVLAVLLLAASFASAIPVVDKGPLDKMVFVHYKKGHGPSEDAYAKGGGSGNKGPLCYTYLSAGTRWKVSPAEAYVVNPTNGDGLGEATITSVLSGSMNKWDSLVAYNIFGPGSVDYSARIPVDASGNDLSDGKNTVQFETLSDPNVIAVTTVWGYFYGPRTFKELLEWDLRFNDYYAWGDAAVDPAKMDLDNIATHELGHSAGMGDIYDSACSYVTMYGYADNGETNKRTLEAPDITGLVKLYS